jgi:GTP-sensing pleiotropic transcriptional regulator CodY
LIETLGAISNLSKILSLYPFEYVHIGLNDLHIERGTVSMFEPYTDGLMSKIVSILRENNQNFGIGGIGKIGADMSPSPECVLNEHFRLNSNGVILSRSFKGTFKEKKEDSFKNELSQSVRDFRNYEKLGQSLNSKQLLDSYKLMKTEIEETIKNANVQ